MKKALFAFFLASSMVVATPATPNTQKPNTAGLPSCIIRAREIEAHKYRLLESYKELLQVWEELYTTSLKLLEKEQEDAQRAQHNTSYTKDLKNPEIQELRKQHRVLTEKIYLLKGRIKTLKGFLLITDTP